MASNRITAAVQHSKANRTIDKALEDVRVRLLRNPHESKIRIDLNFERFTWEISGLEKGSLKAGE